MIGIRIGILKYLHKLASLVPMLERGNEPSDNLIILDHNNTEIH